MQRVFKYGSIQNIILTPDKHLNIFIYRMPSYVIFYSSYKRVMHFKKWSGFFGPPCIYIFYIYIFWNTVYICKKKNDSSEKRTSLQKTPVNRSPPNLAQRVASPTWSSMTIFWAIGLGVLNLWGVKFCRFPISRRSPLTQSWRYRAACDHITCWQHGIK